MTLFSVIGGCTVSLIELENQLRAAEEVLGLVEFKGVALGLQRCDNLRMYPILQGKIATFCEMPSWGIRCGLRVLPKAKYANQHLDVPLGLHMASHNPVSQRMVSAPGESRNDSVKRPLTACDLVWMTILQHKPRASILHGNACARHNDPRTKATEIGLNE